MFTFRKLYMVLNTPKPLYDDWDETLHLQDNKQEVYLWNEDVSKKAHKWFFNAMDSSFDRKASYERYLIDKEEDEKKNDTYRFATNIPLLEGYLEHNMLKYINAHSYVLSIIWRREYNGQISENMKNDLKTAMSKAYQKLFQAGIFLKIDTFMEQYFTQIEKHHKILPFLIAGENRA